MILIYRKATQIICWLAGSAALVLAFFAEPVLWAWTGDESVARAAAPVLRLYALGNGVLALSAFPYYLQFAKGKLKLHIVGNILFVLVLIPSLLWAASRLGAIGAGYAWLASNLLYFFVWVPRVHKRFAPGLHVDWLCRDVGAIFLLALVASYVARAAVVLPQGRLATAVDLGILSIVVLAVASFGAAPVRERFTAVVGGLVMREKK